MFSIAQVGIRPAELNEIVEGEVWTRWCGSEPDLMQVESLAQLHCLRGVEEDEPLGALVRLAARDGGDDELAAVAVVHQLEAGVQQLVCRFRNLDDDVDAVVIGALWEQIRTFPWRRRTGCFAGSLILSTRHAVVSVLMPGRPRRGPLRVFPVDPQVGLLDALLDRQAPSSYDDVDGSDAELGHFLKWAIKAEIVTHGDARLLVELVAADRVNTSPASPQWQRGPCSVAAVAAVAGQRGVCAKTVFRARDNTIGRLREAAARYLVEAA